MTNAPPPIAYATPMPLTPDEDHLRLLVIFHWVVGGIQVVFGFFPIFHLIIGILFATGTLKDPNGHVDPDAKLFGWIFIGVAVTVMLVAWAFAAATLYSGFLIRRRRARTFSLVVAGVNCIHFPFGTALGIFTLIVLLRRSVEDLYRRTAARN